MTLSGVYVDPRVEPGVQVQDDRQRGVFSTGKKSDSEVISDGSPPTWFVSWTRPGSLSGSCKLAP